jgi:hypothetical protein
MQCTQKHQAQQHNSSNEWGSSKLAARQETEDNTVIPVTAKQHLK